MEKLSKFLFLLAVCLFASACGQSAASSTEKAMKEKLKPEIKDTLTYEAPIAVRDTIKEISSIAENASENNTEEEVDKKDSPQNEIVEAKKLKKKKTKPKPKKYPQIVFDEYEHDFGEIEQGESVKYNFVFKNTGKAPLSISKATATCGCTQPSFPFIDIMPDEEGYIGVAYFSVGKEGVQEPEISVFTNDKNNPVVTLQLKGFVHLPEEKKDTLKDTSGIDSPY